MDGFVWSVYTSSFALDVAAGSIQLDGRTHRLEVHDGEIGWLDHVLRRCCLEDEGAASDLPDELVRLRGLSGAAVEVQG